MVLIGMPGPAILQTLTRPGLERLVKITSVSSAVVFESTKNTSWKPPPGAGKNTSLPLLSTPTIVPRTAGPLALFAGITSTLSRKNPGRGSSETNASDALSSTGNGNGAGSPFVTAIGPE